MLTGCRCLSDGHIAGVQASLAAAVEKAQAEMGSDEDAVICITGSMHAVAAALHADLMSPTS